MQFMYLIDQKLPAPPSHSTFVMIEIIYMTYMCMHYTHAHTHITLNV